MPLARVNCAWQNWPGAPGVTTFFLSTLSQANIDAFRTFFNSIAGLIPSNLTIQVPGSGDYIDETDGSISGTWAVGTTPAVVNGSGAGAYAGNAGLLIHWLTNGIVGGRRLRGKTFIVPTIATTFETNGSPTSAAITTLTNAGNALLTAVGSGMAVWSRPVVAHTKYDPKTGQGTGVPGRTGSYSAVNGIRVPDLAISLRSRRV
jgi:hypothetical protein